MTSPCPSQPAYPGHSYPRTGPGFASFLGLTQESIINGDEYHQVLGPAQPHDNS